MVGAVMAETNNKVPVKTEKTPASTEARRPFERVRREMDSLFEDFFGGRPAFRPSLLKIGRSRRPKAALGAIPAVDVAETYKAYRIISELPAGMGEKNVEVRFAEGALTIKR